MNIVFNIYQYHLKYPFSENEIHEMGPECPGKFATLAFSFKSQILMTLEEKSKTNCEQIGINKITNS